MELTGCSQLITLIALGSPQVKITPTRTPLDTRTLLNRQVNRRSSHSREGSRGPIRNQAGSWVVQNTAGVRGLRAFQWDRVALDGGSQTLAYGRMPPKPGDFIETQIPGLHRLNFLIR